MGERESSCGMTQTSIDLLRVMRIQIGTLTLPSTLLEMSQKDLCSCSFVAGWAPGNYAGLERFPRRNIKHEAASLSVILVSVQLTIKPVTNRKSSDTDSIQHWLVPTTTAHTVL